MLLHCLCSCSFHWALQSTCWSVVLDISAKSVPTFLRFCSEKLTRQSILQTHVLVSVFSRAPYMGAGVKSWKFLKATYFLSCWIDKCDFWVINFFCLGCSIVKRNIGCQFQLCLTSKQICFLENCHQKFCGVQIWKTSLMLVYFRQANRLLLTPSLAYFFLKIHIYPIPKTAHSTWVIH